VSDNKKAVEAAKESGSYKKGSNDFMYKILYFITYNKLSYVRRDRHVFELWKKPLLVKFRKKSAEMYKVFKRLEDNGLIYNLTFIGQSYIRFCLNVPPWLTFSEKECKMSNTTVANPALLRDVEELSEWNKRIDRVKRRAKKTSKD